MPTSGNGGVQLMPRLGRRFFERYTPDVAKGLLGSLLVRVVESERLSGRVVETEAYRGADDPASHAYRGLTARNRVMFGEGGRAYIYFSYGNHWCLNVTTETRGHAGAVLIRAIEPVEGVASMRERRSTRHDHHLADGPGKLTRALGVDGSLNGEDMVTSERLFFESGHLQGTVGTSTRVGVSRGTGLGWRFFIQGSEFVSRRRPSLPRNL